MAKKIILDLFCGAGGCSQGYVDAGFEVVGVDLKPQPHYPFEFIQGEWNSVDFDGFDAIHASPPCQAYSVMAPLSRGHALKLIPQVREKLISAGLPYIIENVEGARSELINPITLRGNLFGLRVIRDRLFEVNWPLPQPNLTRMHGTANRGKFNSFENCKFITVAGHNFKAQDGRDAMGIQWMTRNELAQAIPPAYTRWIGKHLLEHLARKSTPFPAFPTS